MAITLDAIELPIDLIWQDEYGFSPVVQNIKKTLTGKLVIQEATQTKGRTFTLTGGMDAAWIDKDTLDLIQAKVDTVDLDMTLDFHGTEYTVRFSRSGNISPIQTKEVYELSNPDAEHIYSIVAIKLIEV